MCTQPRTITTNSGLKWSLDRVTLTLHLAEMDVFWRMPFGYEIPTLATLSLAEHILLTPFGIEINVSSGAQRGENIAVAFSGGVDSAAALQLLPNAIPIQMEVSSPGKQHKVENARISASEVGATIVVSNQNELPKKFGKSPGVYGFGGWTLPSVLLSDHYGIQTIADGNIIEFVFMRTNEGHGTRFADRDFDGLLAPFKKAGFEYCLPCAGLTEVSTTKLARTFETPMGCMRGVGGKPCLNCMKCFRKEALVGRPIGTNPDVDRVLDKNAIPVLGTLLWCARNTGLQHPKLKGFEAKDISWVDKWFTGSEILIPDRLLPYVRGQILAHGIDPLEDESSLRSWRATRDD